MVKDVIHDPIFLGVKSDMATREDLQVAQDLLDTLIANKDGCVGMAANMIGVRKRIIVFDNEGTYVTMFNPEIIKKSGRMIQRKLAFHFSAILVRANAIRVSKFSGKPQSFKLALKLLQVGLRKLSNTKLTIVMVF